MPDVTRILQSIESGDPDAAGELLPLVYGELRRLAAARMAQETPGQTLQATALVHEAYIRLVDRTVPQHWNSRGHFFGAAAEAIRRILVENARRKRTLKRGGAAVRVDVEPFEIPAPEQDVDLLALNEAIERLAESDPVAAKLVDLRHFMGLTVDECADALGMSKRKVERRWTFTRTWLRRQLQGE